MSRVEENSEMLEIFQKSANTADKFEIAALALCDISRSLAIIADRMEENSNNAESEEEI